ncbi:type I restriction modification DNA specificity domain protein [Streptococcus oralis SK304]|uniref:Type I restriction modification DNA specificity domain protein n=1 Tax=Streptococcus oralis SK304 TaxID=1161421 RepID=J5H080_STROR|nr:restriction endonuclease subunit S [Streptococcus oralis]EJP22888.1 type I restriction modification DNA specificity domain protein [Streptococcus oralis SK304]
MGKKNIPRVRFNGFNHQFATKIFGELIKSISTKHYITNVISNSGEYAVIQQGDIPILGYSNEQPFKKYNSVILFGDHTLSLYRPEFPFLLATDGLKVLQSSVLKRDYLYYLTQKYVPKNQGYKRHFSILKSIFINFSQDLAEQFAIGSLFRTLDELLTSYKDNLANYQSLKATMLSKMFPKAGKTVPEIRLDGFEGEWRIIKLGDVLSELKSGLSRELSNDDIGLPVIRANNISDGNLNLDRDIKYWFKEDPKGANTANYFVKENDILVNFINSEAKMGTAAIVLRKPDRETIYTTNILKLTVKEDYYPYFIYLMTFVQSYQNYIKSITKPAVNQASFTTVDFKKYEFLYPAFQEQQAIGSYFSNLDNLINSHQEKISQLETLKKKLLQDMFI